MEENLKDKVNQQKNHLEKIYEGALYTAVFLPNPKYNIGKFENMVPYISYDDILNYKYIIRARKKGITNNYYSSDTDEIIVEYKDIDSLVNDGWILD